MAKTTIELGKSYSIETKGGERIVGTLVFVGVTKRNEITLRFAGTDMAVLGMQIKTIQPNASFEFEPGEMPRF